MQRAACLWPCLLLFVLLARASPDSVQDDGAGFAEMHRSDEAEYRRYIQSTSTDDLANGARPFPRAIGALVLDLQMDDFLLQMTTGRDSAARLHDETLDKIRRGLGSRTPGLFISAKFRKTATGPSVEARWKSLVHSLGALFCTSLKLQALSPLRLASPLLLGDDASGSDHEIRLAFSPREPVCTENLTPWLKFLPYRNGTVLTPWQLLDTRFTTFDLRITRVRDTRIDLEQQVFTVPVGARTPLQPEFDAHDLRPLLVSRRVVAESAALPNAQEMVVTLRTRGESEMRVVYMQEVSADIEVFVSQLRSSHGILELAFASLDPDTSAAHLELSVIVPPNEVVTLRIPFRKVFHRWNNFKPDAERGVDVEPGIVLAGGSIFFTDTNLLSPQTPDFSMPYNVISMASSLAAILFGNMLNSLANEAVFL